MRSRSRRSAVGQESPRRPTSTGRRNYDGLLPTEIEAFNGRFRAERLNADGFLTLADAAERWRIWRRYYTRSAHMAAIGHKVPISLFNRDGATSPRS